MATHSSEIVTECDSTELVVIDKTKSSGKRFGRLSATRHALEAIGSGHNMLLTNLAKNCRVLFVEGEDFPIVKAFAGRLRRNELAIGLGVTVFPIGGFPDPSNLLALCKGIGAAIGEDVLFAGVFDRDYRPTETVDLICSELSRELSYVHIYARKEIENYLLTPEVIDRALARLAKDRGERTGHLLIMPQARDLLEELTVGMRTDVQAQLAAKRLPLRKRLDEATLLAEVGHDLDDRWPDLALRLEVLSGKEVLARLNGRLQDEIGMSLTPRRIIDAYEAREIPLEIRSLVARLDEFRTLSVPVSK